VLIETNIKFSEVIADISDYYLNNSIIANYLKLKAELGYIATIERMGRDNLGYCV